MLASPCGCAALSVSQDHDKIKSRGALRCPLRRIAMDYDSLALQTYVVTLQGTLILDAYYLDCSGGFLETYRRL